MAAMHSMTGFGRAEGEAAGVALSVEISSVNRKSLEIAFHLPRDWTALERPLTDKLRRRLQRGKVSVAIQISRSLATNALSWDAGEVTAILDQLRDLAWQAQVKFEPGADFLLRLVQTLGGSPELPDAEAVWPALEPVVEQALDEHVAMRRTEGASLVCDLSARVGTLRTFHQALSKSTAEAVPAYRERLFARLQKIGLELDLEDERVLKEVALFADRADVSEELTRLASHLAQFDDLLASQEPIGRKLDFLCQEVNREFNTIGSKTNVIEATRTVIDAKNELERIREQAQNLE